MPVVRANGAIRKKSGNVFTYITNPTISAGKSVLELEPVGCYNGQKVNFSVCDPL